jgi:REP element-mobilizing transposase RayT
MKRKYLITIVVKNRRPVFSCKKYCEIFLNRLMKVKENNPFLLYDFILMPDHAHLLLGAKHKYHLSKIIQALKRYSSRDLNNDFKSEMINSAIN